MSTKIGSVDQDEATDNFWPLTSAEVQQLMQAFTHDKVMILEQDAMTLCKWAQQIKYDAFALHLVMAQRVAVSVEGSVVTLGPLAPYLPAMR